MTIAFESAGRSYVRESAADIVRARAGETGETGEVRTLVRRALARLSDSVPPRELAIGRRLSDEAVAFNFLCVLDERGLGRLRVLPTR